MKTKKQNTKTKSKPSTKQLTKVVNPPVLHQEEKQMEKFIEKLIWRKFTAEKPKLYSLLIVRHITEHDKLSNYAIVQNMLIKGIHILINANGQALTDEDNLEWVVLE